MIDQELYHNKWLAFIEQNRKTAEERRLKHYYGASNDPNKSAMKEMDKLKKEMKGKYRKLARLIEDNNANRS